MSENKQELRKCSKCKCIVQLETYFSLNRKGEYKKVCDRCNEKTKIYRQENKEKVKEWKRIEYQKNKEYIKSKARENHYKNKERNNERSKEYHNKNKEKLNKQSREYYANNRESELEKRKQYIKDKKHYCEHDTIKRICKICNTNGYIKNLLCRRIHTSLKAKKSKKTVEYLGCDIDTFKNYI